MVHSTPISSRLGQGCAVEIIAEIRITHNIFLASNLGKKVTTNLGAIQSAIEMQRNLIDQRLPSGAADPAVEDPDNCPDFGVAEVPATSTHLLLPIQMLAGRARLEAVCDCRQRAFGLRRLELCERGSAGHPSAPTIRMVLTDRPAQ